MADINKRVPSCDSDDGERGKRGKRGLIGPTGPTGAAGPVGPTGPAAPEGPPFWPATIPLGDRLVIYANASGDDAAGDGSSTNPYRTLQRAVRDIPQVIDPNLQVYIDITGLGTEQLVDNFVLPPFQAIGTLYRDPAQPYFLWQAPLNIQADPELVPMVTPANAILAAPGDFVATTDANTGRITLTLTGAPRPEWASNALKGKLFFGAAGTTEGGRIVASDTTYIVLARSAFFTSGTPTTPIRIMQETATLLPGFSSAGGWSVTGQGAFTVAGIDTMTIGGVVFADPGLAGKGRRPSLAFYNCGDVVPQFCTINGFDCEMGGFIRAWCDFLPNTGNTGSTNSWYADVDFMGFFEGVLNVPGTLGSSGGDLFFVENSVDLTGAVLSPGANRAAVFTRARAWPGGQGASLLVRACDLVGGGATWNIGISMGGGQAFIQNTNINTFVQSGLTISLGAGFVDLVSAKGSGNGVGVVADNNTQVRANLATNDPTTGLNGTAGADYKCGNLAAAAWTGLATLNVTDPNTFTRIYGV